MPRQRQSFIRQFLASEALGGLLLIAGAVLALIVANSALAPTYFALLRYRLGPLDVAHWINDALMAVFFFVVGLEIKREWLDGGMSTWASRALPATAALAGMVVPAALYLVVAGPGLERGWAIPAATDIAFALGVLALLGDRVPVSLKLFLTTVAIVDDMGAVAVIGLFYTAELHLLALAASAAILAALVVADRLGVRAQLVYLSGALLLWFAVHGAGVHATLAGVLAAFTVPLARGEDHSPLYRLEHALHPWSAYLIVPLFGFANAGVSLAGVTLASLLAPLPLGIALGLFVGKQLGIFAVVRGGVALGWFAPLIGASWLQIYGVALLCGIGFTMSLFIGGLAFADPLLQDEVKIGVLTGSTLSALAGYLVLRLASRPAAAPAG